MCMKRTALFLEEEQLKKLLKRSEKTGVRWRNSSGVRLIGTCRNEPKN